MKNKRGSSPKNSFFSKNHRGISPVIATVLLIAMVIVIGLIVFLWFRTMIEDEGTKFGKNVKLVCDDTGFDARYSSGVLYISNTGNVPVFEIKIKISSEGSHETKDLSTDFPNVNWPELGLNQGGTFSGNIGGVVGSADKITLIPVLMGSSKEGRKTFVCEEQYGYEIII